MLVPLGQSAVDAGATSPAWATGLASVLIQSNTVAYNVGQATLCFGGVFLCWLLWRTRLIPPLLAVLGVIGYPLHLAGSMAEIFGLHISLVLLIPGGLFEVGLALWLLTRGFTAEARNDAAANSQRSRA
jgi:hypothetical protein